MRKTIFAAATALAVASGGMAVQKASAADLDFAPPPPPFVPTWQGFYIGGHVGYGEGTVDFRQDLDIFAFDPETGDLVDSDFNTFRSGFNPDGLLGGVQAGYNWQAGPMVFGVEADISFTDWDRSGVNFDVDDGDVDGVLADEDTFGTVSTDIDFLASVRGRLGYAFDSVMVYGTGGVAWAEAEARSFIAYDDPVGDREFSDKASLDDFGFVAGGGLAWMVIPQTFSVGVEGLYYWFDEKATLTDVVGEPLIEDREADIFATAELHDAWVVRARADFHF